MNWLEKIRVNRQAKKIYAEQIRTFVKKNEVNTNDRMPWHIYSSGQPESYAEYIKHFTWIHYVVKGYFITPCIWLVKAVFGKHLQTEIPPYWYNNTLTIFKTAFDAALLDWYEYFIINLNAPTGKKPTVDEIKELSENHMSSKELRILRDVFLTGVQNDTAYREFFNMLMFEITMGVQKEYGLKGSIQHPLYISKNIMDKTYYVIGRVLNKTKLDAGAVQATAKKPGEKTR